MDSAKQTPQVNVIVPTAADPGQLGVEMTPPGIVAQQERIASSSALRFRGFAAPLRSPGASPSVSTRIGHH